MNNGGQGGSRGYIFQSVAALIDCLERNDWDEIKVEPKTEKDKVDIQLYSKGEILSAIQVKSSLNNFKKSDVQEYLDAAKDDAPNAKEVYIYLITDKYTTAIKQYANDKPDVKELPFVYLRNVLKGKIIEFVKASGFESKVTVGDLKLIEASLLSETFLNSIANSTIKRDMLVDAFLDTLPERRGVNNQKALASCLTQYPIVDDTFRLIGREEEVKEIRKLIDVYSCTVNICGDAGAGKSVIMKKVFHDLKCEGKYVAWVNSRERLQDSLLSLREALGVPEMRSKNEVYESIKYTIKKNLSGKLYLFLDDLYNELDERELGVLSYLQIHLIVSSREGHNYFPRIVINPTSEIEDINLFYAYYEGDDVQCPVWRVKELIQPVRNQPDLIKLLARAVSMENREDVFTFFDVIQEDKIEANHDDNEDKTILDIIATLFERYALFSNSQHRIMKFFSILTPGKEIYYKVSNWANFDLYEIEALIEEGWLARGGMENGYIIHPLIKDSLRNLMIRNGEEVKIEEYGDLLEKVIDTESYLSKIVPYDFIEERIVLTKDIADYFWMSLIVDSERDKKWITDAGTLMNNLALVYYNQGDYEKALEYIGKALAIRERVLGSEHPSTADTYNNLAIVYYDQCDYEKALEYHGKVLAIREGVLGRDHPDTADTYNNMANVYAAQGDHVKALEYYDKALVIRERVLGNDHPDTAMTYNNIASVYYEQGDYGKAMEYNEKALAIYERVLGSNHLDTAMTYNNRALMYDEQGDYDKAMEYHGKALAVHERVLGTKHPDTAKMYYSIACGYCKQGDYEKALEYYQRALKVYLDTFGEEHPHTKIIRDNLTRLQEEMNQ